MKIISNYLYLLQDKSDYYRVAFLFLLLNIERLIKIINGRKFTYVFI